MVMKNPLVGVWGNALLWLLDNFTPPLFPFAGWWNAHALALLPHFISGPMTANFEQGFLWLGELPTEDWAGIGFGLSALLAGFGGRFIDIQHPSSNPKVAPVDIGCSALNVECWMFPPVRAWRRGLRCWLTA